MADAPAAEASKKAKKKDEGGEKKEKLIIQGRKDEDILGSAYVKKFKSDDPTDWSILMTYESLLIRPRQ